MDKIGFPSTGGGGGGATNAADVTNSPAGNIASTNVQDALNELDNEKLATTAANAANITNSPAGNIASTNVQDALNELDNEKLAIKAAITAATKTKITYDANGLVTAGEDLAEGDIPALPESKITNLTTDLANKVDKITSTDDALVRFDGTSGVVQDSTAILTDTGRLGINGNPSAALDVNVHSDGDGIMLHNEDGITIGELARASDKSSYFNMYNGTGDVKVQLAAIGTNSFANYTKLGSDAPAIKIKKYTGTTANTDGGTTELAHNLDSSKILEMSVWVEYTTDRGIFANYTRNAGYECDKYFTDTAVGVTLITGNCANIQDKPFTITVTYEE